MNSVEVQHITSQQKVDAPTTEETTVATVPAIGPNSTERAENVSSKQAIDEEALEILGKHLTIDKPSGLSICDEMISRWK